MKKISFNILMAVLFIAGAGVAEAKQQARDGTGANSMMTANMNEVQQKCFDEKATDCIEAQTSGGFFWWQKKTEESLTDEQLNEIHKCRMQSMTDCGVDTSAFKERYENGPMGDNTQNGYGYRYKNIDEYKNAEKKQNGYQYNKAEKYQNTNQYQYKNTEKYQNNNQYKNTNQAQGGNGPVGGQGGGRR